MRASVLTASAPGGAQHVTMPRLQPPNGRGPGLAMSADLRRDRNLLHSKAEAYALLAACGFKLVGGSGGEHAEMSDASASDAPSLEYACVVLDSGVEMAANGGPPVPIGPVDIKVLAAREGQSMRFDETIGDDYYALTPAEVKALMDAAAAKRAKEERLLTREQREAERRKQKRMYRKAMIRVRFPDGVVLQATFSASAPVSTLLTWVDECLRESGMHPFELSVARGLPLQDLALSLEHAELAPAAMLNFRPSAPGGGMAPPYLKPELMEMVQMMGDEPEAYPQGFGGEGVSNGALGAEEAPGGRRPTTGDGPKRVPAWMRSQ